MLDPFLLCSFHRLLSLMNWFLYHVVSFRMKLKSGGGGWCVGWGGVGSLLLDMGLLNIKFCYTMNCIADLKHFKLISNENFTLHVVTENFSKE